MFTNAKPSLPLFAEQFPFLFLLCINNSVQITDFWNRLTCLCKREAIASGYFSVHRPHILYFLKDLWWRSPSSKQRYFSVAFKQAFLPASAKFYYLGGSELDRIIHSLSIVSLGHNWPQHYRSSFSFLSRFELSKVPFPLPYGEHMEDKTTMI